jgi:hypothetical protein
VHLGHVGRRRGAAGADRPDRLVGDDQLGIAAQLGKRTGELAGDSLDRFARLALASVSPTQTIACRPWASAASPLARISSSLSRWCSRRSEWPTMTSLAPASLSIAAETLPVWAPLTSVWQSWAPMARPPDRATAEGMSVKGGQIATSTPDAARAAAAIGASSAKAARLPFIFQLPATSLRRRFICFPRPVVPSPSKPGGQCQACRGGIALL